MPYLTDRKFSFVSSALDSDTFAVVDFHGEEGLSRCYHFTVMLVSDNPEIDLGSVAQNSAKFTIHRRQGDDVDFNGILTNFEQLQEVDSYVFYRATLVPKLWWLTLTQHNQVFLDQSVKEMVTAVLKDGGLAGQDFEFRLQGEYQKQEFVCQYGESHLNFVTRWLEREGIYYFFEQHPGGEKVIITDTAISHTDSPQGGALYYLTPSGMGDEHREEIIQALLCRYNTVPRSVRLKDYNYRKPSLEMTGSAQVDPAGRGEVYLYGEHFSSPEEGDRLATIRAQELLCRKEEFIGESTVPYIQPGYTFTLQSHYRNGFNQKYLATSMTHQGGQTGFLVAGIRKGLSQREEQVFYRNQFTSIPAGVQYRPPRVSPKPKITGTLNAKIDASGSGRQAELDDQGRYKVVLPFDLSGRKQGKASAWLRMVQPYAGSNHGMHFPLHKDTEVLLTFIEGNPDRPIIAGAAPNPETPSVVSSRDATMSKITTGGGNKIHMEDSPGNQRILLHCDSPEQQSYIRVGSHNDPEDDSSLDFADFSKQATRELAKEGGNAVKKGAEDGYDYTKDKAQDGYDYTKDKAQDGYDKVAGWYKEASSSDGLKLYSVGDMEIKVHNKSETMLGANSSTVIGYNSDTVLGYNSSKVMGADSKTIVGYRTEVFLGGLSEYNSWKAALIPLATLFCATKQTTIGAEDKMVGQKTDLNGNHTELLGMVEKMAAQVTELEGSKETMLGTVEELKGKVSTMEGSTSTMRGQVSDLSLTVATIEGEKNQIAGQVQQIQGDVTTLRSNVTNLEGNMVRLATSSAEISGIKTMM